MRLNLFRLNLNLVISSYCASTSQASFNFLSISVKIFVSPYNFFTSNYTPFQEVSAFNAHSDLANVFILLMLAVFPHAQ